MIIIVSIVICLVVQCKWKRCVKLPKSNNETNDISSFSLIRVRKIFDYTKNEDAVAIGSSNLYQSYYACLRETPATTVIEYGKTQANKSIGENYLTTVDGVHPIHARFYTFGNGEHDVEIMDIQVLPRSSLVQECKGGTVLDKSKGMCVRRVCQEPACDQPSGKLAIPIHIILG